MSPWRRPRSPQLPIESDGPDVAARVDDRLEDRLVIDRRSARRRGRPRGPRAGCAGEEPGAGGSRRRSRSARGSSTARRPRSRSTTSRGVRARSRGYRSLGQPSRLERIEAVAQLLSSTTSRPASTGATRSVPQRNLGWIARLRRGPRGLGQVADQAARPRSGVDPPLDCSPGQSAKAVLEAEDVVQDGCAKEAPGRATRSSNGARELRESLARLLARQPGGSALAEAEEAGTRKGRSFEDRVHAALERIARSRRRLLAHPWARAPRAGGRWGTP